MNREERQSYTLILEARDLGNPVQQTSRLLNVIVKDIDDHPPRYLLIGVNPLMSDPESNPLSL